MQEKAADGNKIKKEGETSKNEKSADTSPNATKISSSLWCVLCSSLAVEIERARARGDAELEKMLRTILKEHQLVSHELN
ncbi:MAG: hypothetical protein ACREAY_04385 [Nitrososphaera sp.]|uniref:hypothetical protein n=1 Tax=Nitrososphaera sp. TaxID=1971748 RepID=UPI003D6E2B54